MCLWFVSIPLSSFSLGDSGIGFGKCEFRYRCPFFLSAILISGSESVTAGFSVEAGVLLWVEKVATKWSSRARGVLYRISEAALPNAGVCLGSAFTHVSRLARLYLSPGQRELGRDFA